MVSFVVGSQNYHYYYLFFWQDTIFRMINDVENIAFFNAKSCKAHRCEADITASWHVNRRIIYKITGAAG